MDSWRWEFCQYPVLLRQCSVRCLSQQLLQLERQNPRDELWHAWGPEFDQWLLRDYHTCCYGYDTFIMLTEKFPCTDLLGFFSVPATSH